MSEIDPTISIRTGLPKGKGGRPKGSGKVQKRIKSLEALMGVVNDEALLRIMKDFRKHPTKMTPLEVMIDISSDVNLKPSIRLAASEKAAPYMHKKMPSFVGDGQSNGAGAAPTIVVINEVKNENATLRTELEAELEAAIAASSSKRKE